MSVKQSGWKKKRLVAEMRYWLAASAALTSISATAGTCNNAAAPYEIPAQATHVQLDSDCTGLGGVATVIGDIILGGGFVAIEDGIGNEENWAIHVNAGAVVESGSAFSAIQFRSPGGSVDISGSTQNTSSGVGVYFLSTAGVGYVANNAAGLISAGTSEAVRFQAGGTVVNNGTISSDSGIAIANSADALNVINTETIATNSGLYAITSGAGGVIENIGTINGGMNIFGSNTLDLTNSGTITGGGNGLAIRTFDIPAIMANSGTITAGAGSTYAIEFLGAGGPDDMLILLPGSTINGDVSAHLGTDTLQFGGTVGTGSFNLSDIGPAAQYQDFETFVVTGVANNWIFSGATGENFSVTGGTLSIDASGATFGGLTYDGGDLDINGNPLNVDTFILNDGYIGGGTVVAASGHQFRGGTFDAIIGDTNTVLVEDGGAVTLGSNAVLNGFGNLAVYDSTVFDLGGTSQSALTVNLSDGTISNGIVDVINSYSVGSGEISAVLTGTADLEKFFSGTVVLSGINSYTGGTTIHDGALIVNGTIGNVVVDGGILGGTGTVGTTDVLSGAVAPGNSIGTLAVDGDWILGTGTTYTVELTGGGTTPGVHSDLLTVDGTATFEDGALIHVMPEDGIDDGPAGYIGGSVYNIIQAGELTVEGDIVVNDDYPYLDFTVSYDGQNLFLTSQAVDPNPGGGDDESGAGNAVGIPALSLPLLWLTGIGLLALAWCRRNVFS